MIQPHPVIACPECDDVENLCCPSCAGTDEYCPICECPAFDCEFSEELLDEILDQRDYEAEP